MLRSAIKFPLALVTIVLVVVGSRVFAASGDRHAKCMVALSDGKAPTEVISLDSASRVLVLNRILDEREKLVLPQVRAYEALQTCLRAELTSGSTCAEAHQRLTDLNKIVGLARLQLGAGQSPYEMKSWLGKADHAPNAQLKPYGTYKIASWEPLNQKELGYVNEALQVFARQSRELYQSGTDASRSQNDYVMANRYGFFKDYLKALSSEPLLQWLTSPTVDLRSLDHALSEFLKLAHRDLKVVEQERIEVSFYAGMAEVRPLINKPLHYMTIVNRLAGESTDMCLALAQMKKELAVAEGQDQLAIFAGTAPLFLLSGPEMIIANMAFSAGTYYVAHQNVLDVRASEFTGLTRKLDKIDFNILRQAQTNEIEDVVGVALTAPLFQGGRLVFKTTRTAFVSSIQNRHLLINKLTSLTKGPL